MNSSVLRTAQTLQTQPTLWHSGALGNFVLKTNKRMSGRMYSKFLSPTCRHPQLDAQQLWSSSWQITNPVACQLLLAFCQWFWQQLVSEQLLVGIEQAIVLCALHMQWQRCQPSRLCQRVSDPLAAARRAHRHLQWMAGLVSKAIMVKSSRAWTCVSLQRMHPHMHLNKMVVWEGEFPCSHVHAWTAWEYVILIPELIRA